MAGKTDGILVAYQPWPRAASMANINASVTALPPSIIAARVAAQVITATATSRSC
jgi:hypothetical protein